MEYKAYAFDLDDNLLKLPTKISLKTSQGKTKKLSTLDFEKVRTTLKENNLHLHADSFQDFHNDTKFLKDIKSSEKAGSWQNLENCIVKHSSLFAVITARGHSPAAIKSGLKLAITKNITKSQLEKFKEKFSTKYKTQSPSTEEALDKYLDLCKFYPVNNPKIKKELGSQDTGELKSCAFEDFQNYVKDYVKNKFGKNTKVKIGFSDDSIFHLKTMVNNILKKHGLFFYQTSDDGKNDFI